MKKLIIPLLALAAVACTREMTDAKPDLVPGRDLTIVASYGDPETRTERAADGAVLWSPGDEISLFYGSGTNGGSRFVGQNTEPAKVVNFTGKIGVITGGNDVAIEDTYFWAVYPYNPVASCDGSSVITALPSSQVAQADTFADNLFLSIGRSQGLTMGFYNICGGLKFTISEVGIKSVTLQGHNHEAIAGTITVAFDSDGLPTITNIADGQESITVSAPDGQTFEVGRAYYIVLIPTVFENGFTLTFDKGFGSAVYDRTKKTTIRRSAFGSLTTPDKDLTWTRLGVPIPDDNFCLYMVQNYDTNGNGYLDYEEAEAVTSISVNTDNISSLAGIEYCRNLTDLYCNGSGTYWDNNTQTSVGYGLLTSLDVSQNTQLRTLACNCNRLTSLNLTNNASLWDLYCYGNQLTGIDLTNNASLRNLSCSSNQLTGLDLSHNPELIYLYCGQNKLTDLNVSNNLSLESLSVADNQLTSIDLNQNAVLREFNCGNNKLTDLVVSNNTSLMYLYCFNNQLTGLDLSQNAQLIILDCGWNKLTSISLGNLTSLESIYVNGNQLTDIDLSANTGLRYFGCESNRLTNLDLSQCTLLQSLYCSNNLLTSLDLSVNAKLRDMNCDRNKIKNLNVSKNPSLVNLYCNPMTDNYNRNLLDYIFVTKGQSINGVTCNRDYGCIPEETTVVVIPEDGESESTIDESLDGNVLEENNLEANGAVLFEDDFEWISTWASASGAGDTIGANDPSASAPNVFTSSSCDGFMDEFSSRGYKYLWGSADSGGWSDSLGDDNPRVMYIQSNYLKFGKTRYNAAIKLPALDNVPGPVDAVLSFDWAWQVTGALRPDIMSISIDIEGDGAYYGDNIESSQSRDDYSSNLAWQHAKVLLSGINSGSRITIRPTNYNPEISNPGRRQNRWFLDNIKVVSK